MLAVAEVDKSFVAFTVGSEVLEEFCNAESKLRQTT